MRVGLNTNLVFLIVLALLSAGCCCLTTDRISTTTPTSTPTYAPVTNPSEAVTTSTSESPTTAAVISTPTQTYTLSGNTGGAETLSISVLDVGQGDSILIQTPNGKTMLVDAGDSDAGSRIVSVLRNRGVASLDVAVASHAHADHIGGYQAVLSTFPVGVFYDSGYPATSATFERLLNTIDQKNIQFVTPTRGQTIDIDPSVRIDVLSPDGNSRGEIHDNMLVLRLSYGTFSALLTGDMPDSLEDDIASPLRPTTVLKVGHHGSRTSSSAAFLNRIKPQVAIISVGAGNSYGHPTADALQRLRNVGATVYRTDQSGSVTISTDGNSYTVATDRNGGSAGTAPAASVATTQKQATRSTVAAVVPVSSSAVAITAVDLKGETVTITNSGSSTANLAGWRLTDEGAKHSYTFSGTSLPSGGSITIASGTGSGEIKWTGANVWNNDGDTAYLYDGSGNLVSQRRG